MGEFDITLFSHKSEITVHFLRYLILFAIAKAGRKTSSPVSGTGGHERERWWKDAVNHFPFFFFSSFCLFDLEEERERNNLLFQEEGENRVR